MKIFGLLHPICFLQLALVNAFTVSKNVARVEKTTLQAETSRRNFIAGTIGAAATSSIRIPKVYAEENSELPIKLPPIGLGAWAWGDALFWGYNPKQDNDLKEVFDFAVMNNVPFFDTAELYGLGRSESLIGQFRKEYPEVKVQVATKFAALPFRTKPQDVVNACKGSVKRLGGEPIDLYQIHFPNAWSNEEYWEGLSRAYDEGLVKAVGVSNYGVDALRACHRFLKERGIPLATNQIQLSLLYRYPLENGLIDTCKELGVQVLSYSPLALGFLTGKYNRDNLPSGPRNQLGKSLFESQSYDTLLKTMEDIANNHDNASVSQVAINWARAKGSIPIPGARTLKQAKQNLNALTWNLSREELDLLDTCKVSGFVTPDVAPFPKKDINTGLVMFDS